MQKHYDSNNSKQLSGKAKRIWLSVVSFLIVALFVFVVLDHTPTGHLPGESTDAFNNTSASPTIAPTQEPELTYTEMTLLSVGDIMYHGPQLTAAYNSATQTYDFNNNFQYIKEIVSAADLAVANFETTLHNTTYSSYPTFCSPVSTLDAIKTAGFDVLLYANNHIFDRRQEGLLNTLDRFTEYGFSYVGATKDPETQRSCGVYEINGVRVGIINYADSLTADIDDVHTINGIRIPNEYFYHMNIYVQGQEEEFYNRVADDLKYLNEQKVDIIVSYLHWGWEYYLEENDYQRATAQKLCNMGVDVIIGSHPHVVQPMDTLVSETDPNHSTLCFYSLGNYISNQNRNATDWSNPNPGAGYSENGLTVTLTIRRYSDGTTLVSNIDYTPTWVHRFYLNGKMNYEIIPLPVAEEDYESYGLYNSSYGVSHALESFERTDSVFREEVATFNENAQAVIKLIEEQS